MPTPEVPDTAGTDSPVADAPTTGQITGEMIKAVRRETRAGAIDCRQALEASGGDVEGAIAHLREKRIGTPKKVWV